MTNINHKITYLNTDIEYSVDDKGFKLISTPSLYLNDSVNYEIRVINSSLTPIDVSGYSYIFGCDNTYNHSHTDIIRTSNCDSSNAVSGILIFNLDLKETTQATKIKDLLGNSASSTVTCCVWASNPTLDNHLLGQFPLIINNIVGEYEDYDESSSSSSSSSSSESSNSSLQYSSSSSSSSIDDFKWLYTLVDANSAIQIDGAINTTNTLSVPSTIIDPVYGDLPVKYITNNAFQNNTNFTSLTFGNNITNIGDFAFDGCINVTNIIFNLGVCPTIGINSFSGMTLTSLTIGDTAIWGTEYTALSTGPWYTTFSTFTGALNIRSGVFSIGQEAFCDNSVSPALGCQFTGTLTIPNSVNYIWQRAFMGCNNFTNLVLGSGFSLIESATFYGCSNLTSLNIPNNITQIANYSFGNCTNLASLTIGNGVTNIGNYVFDSCNSLSYVKFEGNAPTLGTNIFTGTSLTQINVNTGSTGWGTDYEGIPIVYV